MPRLTIANRVHVSNWRVKNQRPLTKQLIEWNVSTQSQPPNDTCRAVSMYNIYMSAVMPRRFPARLSDSANATLVYKDALLLSSFFQLGGPIMLD
jgi:hypothetical protein